MSGVVNKSVADKAVSVGADELIRKPFQPQDLIARVKSFLSPKSEQPAAPAIPAPRPSNSHALNNFFAPPPAPTPVPIVPVAQASRPESAWPRALTDAFTPQPHILPQPSPLSHSQQHSAPPSHTPSHNFNIATPNRPQASATDIQKLKTEISRLELLIKKLQTELQIERQYNQALELHVKSLTSLD
jgi:DNA-binding response OmpR family regulator